MFGLVRYGFVNMPDAPIKLFRFVRNCCQTMGCIDIDPSNQKQPTVNSRIFFFFVPVLLMFLSTTGFIIFEAATILEYAAAMYVSTTELAIMVNISVIYWKIDDILQLTDMMEKRIEQSKKIQFSNCEKQRKSEETYIENFH